MKKEMVFTGSGGQGLGIMGRILALAAVSEGKEVVVVPSYGGEVTGGFSQSEIIVSDEKIDFPGVMAVDILVAMSQEGYDKWISKVPPESRVFFDIDIVKTILPAKACHIPVPSTRKALELGSRMAANMVILGALSAITELVSLSSLFEVVKKESGKFTEINLCALREGYKIGKQYLMHINQKGDE